MIKKNNKFDLSANNALITGAAGLLGLEHAKALLEVDCSVVLTDVNYENLQLTYLKLKEKYNPKKIKMMLMDVTSEISVTSVLDSLNQEKIFIDILVNNAAVDPKVNENMNILSPSRLENFDIEQWNNQIAVGLTGALNCIKVFGYEMSKSKSDCVILNIASDLSVIAPDQRIYKIDGIDKDKQQVKPVTYSVIKSGLIGLTKYVATYWAKNGVRCNALSPGGVFNNQSETFVSRLRNLIPMDRMAKKDEYHGAIQFLCSEASSYMNGQNIIIDGGRSIW